MEQTNMRYTDMMEDAVFLWGDLDDYDGDYSELIENINNPNFFRTFGEALLNFMQQRDATITTETAHRYIEACCQQTFVPRTNIAKNPNTLKDWFKKDVRPRKGETSRQSMFALAFALQLKPQETADLFHKVYLDRAFDFRNPHEIVYYFCLHHKKSWEDAQRIISCIAIANPESEDQTIATVQIKTAVLSMSDEKTLVEYINSHGHNLAQTSTRAKSCLAELIRTAAETVELETSLEARRKWAADNNLKTKELAEENSLLNRYKKCDSDSNNHIYEIITEQRVHCKEWRGTKTLFSNARLPDEIRKRFPEAVTFSKKDRTYEEQRKLIILLASYIHWFKASDPAKYSFESTPNFDDYVDWIDGYLIDCGLSPMYYGNPYDWLFMWCTLSENPLNRFRGVLADVLDGE